jgi:sodium/potassium-transporting ATPase subunit alpha
MSKVQVINAFATMITHTCMCIRDGQTIQIDAEGLVVGDVVLLRTGARVPADLRLISCTDLKLETSSFTGESEPLDATPDMVSEDSGVSPLDARNIAFNSSMVIEGEAYGVVIRVGDNTFIGRSSIGIPIFDVHRVIEQHNENHKGLFLRF